MIKYPALIILAILLFCSTVNGQQQDGSVFEKKITIHENNQSINVILDQLSWQAGIYFSYDATIIDSEKKYSLDIINKSLFTALNQLFKSDLYNFIELDNQVIITRKSTSNASIIPEKDSVQFKYYFMSGRIIDEKREDPVAYATISFLNQSAGTISNIDGEFILKVHPDNVQDTVVISSLGYHQIRTPAYTLMDEDLFVMKPASIRIKEVKITGITTEKLLQNIRAKIPENYSEQTQLMTAFYRETVQQDGNYISASEAIIEILKASYTSTRDDLVRLIKGRRSADVIPINWINLKLQGGPFTMTKLDAVKTLESFINEDSEPLYQYHISKTIWYNNNPVYVLKFKPLREFSDQMLYTGEMFVHRETFAVVHIEFYLSRTGLKNAERVLIKKKPRGVKAKPTDLNYVINYQFVDGKWHISNAQVFLEFKIRSRKDQINSVYQSISDLLVTETQPTELKRFARDESLGQRDIFVEMINEYDPGFWENYNIIKPNEKLELAIKNQFEVQN